MTAWLEIVIEQLVQVLAHPMNGIAALHSKLIDAANLDAPRVSFRNRLVDDSGWTIASSPPAVELRAALDPVADRVTRQRTQRFESDVHEFYYSLRNGDGVVRVAGSPPGVLGSSVWAPLWLRLAGGFSAGAIAVALAMIVGGKYLSRAEWFEAHGNGGAVLLAGLLAACFVPLAVMGAWLPSRARSGARVIVPTVLAAVAWACVPVLWFVGAPDLARVNDALGRGELADARLEAEALMVVDHDSDLDAAIVHLEGLEADQQWMLEDHEDVEHLQRVRDSESLREAVDLFGAHWNHDRLVPEARALILGRATREIQGAFERDEEAKLSAVADLVVELDDPLAERARSRALLARAATCRKAASFDCAIEALAGFHATPKDTEASRKYEQVRSGVVQDLATAVEKAEVDAKDLDVRAKALSEAVASAQRYEALVGSPGLRSAASLKLLMVATAKSLALQHEKEAAAARKAEAVATKKRAAEERRAAAAERRAQRGASRASWSEPSGGGCCKYCSTGKPCGDSCISQSKACHKGAGCAC